MNNFNVNYQLLIKPKSINNQEKCIDEKLIYVKKNIFNKLKNLFKSNSTIPIIIYGKKGIGKFTLLLTLLYHSNLYNGTISKYKRIKHNDINLFNVYNDNYDKLYKYSNLFYLNFNNLKNSEEQKYLNFIENISLIKSIDSGIKIFIFKNIHTLTILNQSAIFSIIEKSYENNFFLMTTSKINNISSKLISLCLCYRYPVLNKNEFIEKIKLNYKNIYTSEELLHIETFYQIYINNKFKLSSTFLQIEHLRQNNLLNKDSLDIKKTTMSLEQMLISNIVNEYFINYSMSNIVSLRKQLNMLLSLNIDIISLVTTMTNLLLNSKLSFQIKKELVDSIQEFNINYTKSDKEVVHLETLFISIIDNICRNKLLSK
tara:strand:+ start:10740 stop:11855 length:1116 start_codon:yes stop_codon:yes gene_type:complete